MWHRRTVKQVLVIAAVFAVGVAVGIPIGARVGLWEFMLAEAQYKASSLASDIRSIKAGDRERVLTSMEISLNAELAKHGEYMESHLWWLWPELRSSDDRSIRTAVSYRLANPYEGPDFEKPESWRPGIDMQDPFVRDVIAGQRTQRDYMRKVLQRFGVSADSSTVDKNARNSGTRPAP
jgi:hypothetical protein